MFMGPLNFLPWFIKLTALLHRNLVDEPGKEEHRAWKLTPTLALLKER
jgi:hypothetical protein